MFQKRTAATATSVTAATTLGAVTCAFTGAPASGRAVTERDPSPAHGDLPTGAIAPAGAPATLAAVDAPTAVARRAWPPRRYDPPHILWYFGAIAAAATASATVFSVGLGARGTYQLLVGL